MYSSCPSGMLPMKKRFPDMHPERLKEKKFAPYKLPERLEIIDQLPRVGDQQKVDKKVLEKDIVKKLKKEGKG